MKDFKFYLKKVQIISESEDEFNNIKSIIDDLKIAIKTNDLEQINFAIENLNNKSNQLENKQHEEIIKSLEEVPKMIKSSSLSKDTKEYILNLYIQLKDKIKDDQHDKDYPFSNDPDFNFMMKNFTADIIKRNDVIYAFYLDLEKEELGFTDSSTKENITFIFNNKKELKKEIKIKNFTFKNVFDITPENIQLKLDIESPNNIKEYLLQQKIDDKIISKNNIKGNTIQNITLDWNDTLILTVIIDDEQKIVIQYALTKYS